MIITLYPWGNPNYWSTITYRLNGLKRKSATTKYIIEESLKNEIKSNSNKFNDERIESVILVSDTLVSELGGDYEVENYNDIIRDVKQLVFKKTKEFKEIYYENNGISEMNDVKENIIVLPGIGSFRKNLWSFKGNALDWYSQCLIELYTLFFSKDGVVDRIVLDVTHGLNYMTIFSETVGFILAQLLSVRQFNYNKGLTVDVFNSEPYDGFARENNNLKIHKIKSIDIHGLEFTYKPSWKPRILESYKIQDNKKKAEISSRFKNLSGVLSKTRNIGICWNTPLPLLLAYSSRDLLESVNKISDNFITKILDGKIKEYFYNNIKIVRTGEGSIVHRQASYNHETLLQLLEAMTVVNMMDETFPISKIKDHGMTLGKMKEITQYVYRDPLQILALNELSNLKRREDELKEKVKMKEDGCFMREITKEDVSKGKELDKRIFVAHAGLQEDVVYVRYDKENDCILFSYKPEIEKVFKILR